jgi:NADH dehydrogenase FAD-containing subunit
LTFVVIGAGPTGVELVGQVAELAHIVLPRDYRSVDTTEAKILLLEGAGAVLGPFDPKLQRYTQARLEKMGVEVRLNTLAVDMDQESITVKGPGGMERIPTRTRIWAAGVQASPLAKMLAEATGAETEPGGSGDGESRLHTSGASGGVRGRGHGVVEPAPRGGAAGDPGGQVRRQGAQSPAGRREQDRTVQVFR